MYIKKWFDTFAERKEYEKKTKFEVIDYGIEFVEGRKMYFLKLQVEK